MPYWLTALIDMGIKSRPSQEVTKTLYAQVGHREMREEIMGSLKKSPHLRTVLWRQLGVDERPQVH